MSFDIATARRLVLRYLLSVSRGPQTAVSVEALEDQIGQWYAEESGRTSAPPSGDWSICLQPEGLPRLHEVLWDFVVQRVLSLSNHEADFRSATTGWKYLRLTEYGREVVKEQGWSPYDPDGYLRELASEAPRLVQVCRIYVEEALHCFRNGCYLATTVMLGAASEGAMRDLFQGLAEAMRANGHMPEWEAYVKKLGRTQSVFEKHAEFKKHFDRVRVKLPRLLNDDLDLQLDGVFNLIRYYRNSSGHPTGTEVDRMAAFTSLVLFVPYCRRIEALSNWLATNAKELHT